MSDVRVRIARTSGYRDGMGWANRNPGQEAPDLTIARLFLEARKRGRIPGAPAAPRGALYRLYRDFFHCAVKEREVQRLMERRAPRGQDGARLGTEWADFTADRPQCPYVLPHVDRTGHLNCALVAGHAHGHRTNYSAPQPAQRGWIKRAVVAPAREGGA